MRIVVALMAWFLLGTVHAQQPHPRIYQQAELDALLAPIALHPDGLVSQILIAATYPEEVAAAARWSRANAYLRGDDAVRAVHGEPWDPSVKALVAFPDLLARMEESPQWLHDLGEAFLLQEAHVMATVQGLRRRAYAAGHLASTEHSVLYQQGEAIVVQPRTQIVYVHYYDPYVVYGPWWWPHYRPVYWHPWTAPPVFLAHGFFFSKPDWHRRHVRVVHRPVHVHHHHHTHVVPGKWRHRNHVLVKPHVHVPEAQRQPIVQQHMPAVSGFSHQRKEVREHRGDANHHRERDRRSESHPEHRRESNHGHLVAPTVRPHVRVPEAQRQPIVHSAPLTSPVAREASRHAMPPPNAFSQQRKDVREHREDRSEAGHRPQRERVGESVRQDRGDAHHQRGREHRQHSERRGHRG
jgi:hypothetical protein